MDLLPPWMYKPELYVSCTAWFSGTYVSVPATADITPNMCDAHIQIMLEGSSITMTAGVQASRDAWMEEWLEGCMDATNQKHLE